MKISLSEGFTYLQSAKQRNFFARLISALSRVEQPGLGTLAVGINRQGKFVLYYDPAFLGKLHFIELVLSLEHEVYHIILDHIPRYLDLLSSLVDDEEKKRFQSVMNVAADCAGNELMRAENGFDDQYKDWFYGSEATDGRAFIIPETFNLARLQPFEIYMFQLMAQVKKATKQFQNGASMDFYSLPMKGGQGQEPSPGQGQGQGQGKEQKKEDKSPSAMLSAYFNEKTNDRHQFWAQGCGEEKPNAEELQGLADKLRQEATSIVRTAVEEHLKSRGTIPAGLQEYIEAMLARPTIPWPKALRDWVSRTHQSKLERGMSRPSRRLHGVPDILPFPGHERDRRFTILYALDTSGSMSTEDCKLGLTELVNIIHAEPDVSLHVMYCDAELHTVYKVESVDQIDFTIAGRGGTDFNPPFIRCRELLRGESAPDILIYATDGYAPAPEPDNRVPIPVVWLITPTGQVPSEDYGHHIRMEPF